MRIAIKLRFIPLFIGIVTLIVGFYYSAIKAGVPYQDPTPEMTEKYTHYMNIGDTLMLIGFIAIVIATIFLIVLKIINKNISRKNINIRR